MKLEEIKTNFTQAEQDAINRGEHNGPMDHIQIIDSNDREKWLKKLLELGLTEESIKRATMLDQSSSFIKILINNHELKVKAGPSEWDYVELDGEEVKEPNQKDKLIKTVVWLQRAMKGQSPREAVRMLARKDGNQKSVDESMTEIFTNNR